MREPTYLLKLVYILVFLFFIYDFCVILHKTNIKNVKSLTKSAHNPVGGIEKTLKLLHFTHKCCIFAFRDTRTS